MFNDDFYPTPKSVVHQMLTPYLNEYGFLSNINILEPSAGKGDIVDVINSLKGSSKGIFCIESHPELQAILKDKNYKLIGDDFFQFAGGIPIDLFVMNPPFSNGVDHILHAWDVLVDGDIVCLLNSETVKNPNSRKRALLNRLIGDYGSVEHIGPVFKNSERHTNVNVCIVRLKKMAENGILDGIFDDAYMNRRLDLDTDILDENQIVRPNAIKNIINLYNSTLGIFSDIIKLYRRLNYYGGSICDVIELLSESIDKNIFNDEKDKFKDGFRKSYSDFQDGLQKKAWENIFSKTNVSKFMTKSVLREFDNLKKQQSDMEFSEQNVLKLIDILFMSREGIAEGAILEAFDLMTKYYKENRIYIEGWKANDVWRVNKKFILPRIVESWVVFNKFHLNCQRECDLNDIDRAMCFIDGKDFDKIQKTSESIRDACKNGEMDCESEFFVIRFYKKGTAHFKFKDVNLWESFNLAACKGKKWLPDKN